MIDPALARESLFTPDNPLTPREREIARLLLSGVTSSELARKVHLSPGSVRNVVSSIMTKTAANNRYEAATKAQTQGWI